MRKTALQTIIEAVSYLGLAYMTLPPHEQQRIRMIVYSSLERVGLWAGTRCIDLASRASVAYDRERVI